LADPTLLSPRDVLSIGEVSLNGNLEDWGRLVSLLRGKRKPGLIAPYTLDLFGTDCTLAAAV
jgi:hypothetical protein